MVRNSIKVLEEKVDDYSRFFGWFLDEMDKDENCSFLKSDMFREDKRLVLVNEVLEFAIMDWKEYKGKISPSHCLDFQELSLNYPAILK